MSKSSRWWPRLAAPAVLALLTLLFLAGTQPTRYKRPPSGHALLDRYAELVAAGLYRHEGAFAARLRRLLGFESIPGLGGSALDSPYIPSDETAEDSAWVSLVPPTRLLALKEEFADDPGYWQLTLASPSRTPELEAAIARGVADEASYALIGYELYRRPDKAGRLVATPGTGKYLELLDAAIALNPDNAYFYYTKANLLLELGRREEAYALFAQGNRTPLNYHPNPFPANYLLRGSGRQQWPADPRGQFIDAYMLSRTPVEILLFRRAAMVAELARLGPADLERRGTLYEYARRMTAQEDSILIVQLIGLGLLDLTVDSLPEDAAGTWGKFSTEVQSQARRCSAAASGLMDRESTLLGERDEAVTQYVALIKQRGDLEEIWTAGNGSEYNSVYAAPSLLREFEVVQEVTRLSRDLPRWPAATAGSAQ